MTAARRLTFLVLLAVFGHTTPAAAEWLLIPFAGMTAGASTGYFNPDDAMAGSTLMFGAAGVKTWGRFAAEAEFGVTPGFFNSPEGGLINSSTLATISGSAIANIPVFGRFRPYALLGVSAIRVEIRDAANVFPTSEWTAGLSAGGGMFVPLNGRMRVRADVRYTRSLRRDGADSSIGFGSTYVDFWRATAGLAISFR